MSRKMLKQMKNDPKLGHRVSNEGKAGKVPDKRK